MYGVLFSCVGYTRNGLFYVPLFLMLGAVSRPAEEGVRARDGVLLVVSLLAVATEAFLTSALGWQRHDSMYLSLPFASWFLFRILLSVRPRARCPLDAVAPASETVYLVHPYAIVAVRGAARLVPVLVSSVPLFSAVLALSFAVAMGASRAAPTVGFAATKWPLKRPEASFTECERGSYGQCRNPLRRYLHRARYLPEVRRQRDRLPAARAVPPGAHRHHPRGRVAALHGRRGGHRHRRVGGARLRAGGARARQRPRRARRAVGARRGRLAPPRRRRRAAGAPRAGGRGRHRAGRARGLRHPVCGVRRAGIGGLHGQGRRAPPGRSRGRALAALRRALPRRPGQGAPRGGGELRRVPRVREAGARRLVHRRLEGGGRGLLRGGAGRGLRPRREGRRRGGRRGHRGGVRGRGRRARGIRMGAVDEIVIAGDGFFRIHLEKCPGANTELRCPARTCRTRCSSACV